MKDDNSFVALDSELLGDIPQLLAPNMHMVVVLTCDFYGNNL